MESSSSKVEAIKPVILKAGIPLAISLAGFVIARIATRKSFPTKGRSPPSVSQVNQETDDQESFHSLDSVKDDHHTYEAVYSYHTNALEPSVITQEEILELRRRIEDMQDREWKLEKKFISYQEMKDKEMGLMEIQNKLVLEMNRAEFMGREISMWESENHRFENNVMEYLNVLRLLEFSRLENEKLHEKVKRLLRKNKEYFLILRKQSLLMQYKEREISENRKDIEGKDDCIRLMEEEIRDLKLITEIVQGEKNELSDKLRAAEESTVLNKGEETVNIENDNELIYLRWANACLRHELMRRNQEQESEQTEENYQMEQSFGGVAEIEEFGSDNETNRQVGTYLGFTNRDHSHSRRRKLMAKLKKWVDGSEKTKLNLDEKLDKYGSKCFRRRSAFDGAEEAYLSARNSCSSA